MALKRGLIDVIGLQPADQIPPGDTIPVRALTDLMASRDSPPVQWVEMMAHVASKKGIFVEWINRLSSKTLIQGLKSGQFLLTL